MNSPHHSPSHQPTSTSPLYYCPPPASHATIPHANSIYASSILSRSLSIHQISFHFIPSLSAPYAGSRSTSPCASNHPLVTGVLRTRKTGTKDTAERSVVEASVSPEKNWNVGPREITNSVHEYPITSNDKLNQRILVHELFFSAEIYKFSPRIAVVNILN